MGEVQRIDEQARVANLPTGAGAHEAPKLLPTRPPPLRWLPLKRTKRTELTLGVDDLFYGSDTKGTDQLVLQIGDAHIEAQPFHLGTSQLRAEAGLLQTAPEVAHLCRITKAGQFEVTPPEVQFPQEA